MAHCTQSRTTPRLLRLIRMFMRALLGGGVAASMAVLAQDLPILDRLPTGDYAAFAVGTDASSFDAGHPQNKLLIDKGVGRPVRAVQVFERHALVMSNAARVLVPVPLGWLGFEDGGRTRLFHPNSDIVLVVTAFSIEQAGGWDYLREQFWLEVRQQAPKRKQEAPRYDVALLRLANDQFGVRETNVPDRNGPFSSVIVFMRHPGDPARGLRINVFAPVEDFERYVGLASLVLRDIRVPQR